MKRTLALMAAALIAAPFGVAVAEDHGHAAPAADAAVEAAADAVAPVEHTLKDGVTKVVVEGDAVFVLGADGTKTPAPDGDHVLADDTVLKTMGGKVVPAAPAAETPAQ